MTSDKRVRVLAVRPYFEQIEDLGFVASSRYSHMKCACGKKIAYLVVRSGKPSTAMCEYHMNIEKLRLILEGYSFLEDALPRLLNNE